MIQSTEMVHGYCVHGLCSQREINNNKEQLLMVSQFKYVMIFRMVRLLQMSESQTRKNT